MHRAPALLWIGLVAGLAAGCSETSPGLSPPPSTLAPVELATQGDRRLPIRLSSLLESALVSLPESNLPEGSGLPGQFPLSGSWSAEGQANSQGLRVWSHELPIRLKSKKHARAPEGVRILVGGEPVPFGNLPSNTRREGWDIDEDQILLLAKENPGRGKAPMLVMEAERSLQERINFGPSGMSPEEFLPYQLTEGGITRTGLLLPAISVCFVVSWLFR